MSKRYISVRVLRPDGRPAPGVRVAVELHQAMVFGVLPPQMTRSDGSADCVFDLDTFGEVTIMVGGNVVEKRAAPKAHYTFVL